MSHAESHASPRPDIPRRAPEFILGAAVLLLFISLTSLQVFTRYVLNEPLAWTEELTAHLLIWLVFIGAVGVHREDTHIRVEMIDEWLPRPVVAVIRLLYDLVIFITLVLLVWSGIELYQSMRFDKLPALRWPMRYIITVVPASAALMAIFSLGHIWSRLKIIRKASLKGAKSCQN